ncbi:MAG TPA: site-specific DNA-methyltransferase [Patescibacteria group bacterium]|nr:site-specific DNA-methyltransferase [Patescibacteria group bacterium]
MNEYKAIKISSIAISKHKDDLRDFFGQYPKEDIHFEIDNNNLVINLRQIDFPAFKNNAELVRSNNGFNQVLDTVVKNIENIKSYGLKGSKRLYVGYNKERKVKNRKDKEKRRGIYYYAQNHTFSKQNNILPENFVNKIITGDSAKVLKQFPDNSVDLIFTSPPYNFGLDYENHTDGTDWNDYFDKLFSVFRESIRVLKYGGRIIVNVQPLFSDYIPIHHIISNFFMNEKLIWKGEIVWDKHNWNCKYTAWGSWKSPSNPYLKYTWEFLEIFSKGDLKKQGERENIDISADEFKKLVVAKWNIAPERKMKEYGHPAMFPENLASSAMKLFSYRGDIILDPFNGVGTTTAVAKKLGRKYVGIDVSEEYNKKAEKRLANTQEELTLFNKK